MKNYEKPPIRIRQIEGNPPCFIGNELARIATAYARVFAGDPWNEVSRCQERFWPDPVGSQCDTCGEMRTEAYPLAEQIEVIAKEMQRPDAACFVLEDEQRDEIVGFSWGFAYENADAFIEDKYAGAGSEYEQLRNAVRRSLGRYAIGEQPFYYLSETGIVDSTCYRNRGISREFVRLRCEVADNLGLDIVQRTSSESYMYQTMQGAGFAQIMGANISEPDVVNPERVLFAKKVELGIV